MSNTIKITIKVSDGLYMVHSDYFGSKFDQLEILSESSFSNDAIADALLNVSILANNWSKQKLAEHCNTMLVCHSSFVRSKNVLTFDLNYPHLRVSVKRV